MEPLSTKLEGEKEDISTLELMNDSILTLSSRQRAINEKIRKLTQNLSGEESKSEKQDAAKTSSPSGLLPKMTATLGDISRTQDEADNLMYALQALVSVKSTK